MTKQPKVRKPHPVLHGIGLVLSVILLVAVLIGTYVLSTMATIIDSFIGAPSGHYTHAEIADTKVKAEALSADGEAEGTVLVQNNDNTLPLSADTKKVNVFGWASTAWLGGGSGSGGVSTVNTDLLAALTAYGVEYNTELTDMYKDFQDGREYTRTLSAWPEQSGRLYEPDINNRTYYTQSITRSRCSTMLRTTPTRPLSSSAVWQARATTPPSSSTSAPRRAATLLSTTPARCWN